MGAGRRDGRVGEVSDAADRSPVDEGGDRLEVDRSPGGQGGGKLYMVDITGKVEQPVPTPSYASDPTWSPLLSGK